METGQFQPGLSADFSFSKLSQRRMGCLHFLMLHHKIASQKPPIALEYLLIKDALRCLVLAKKIRDN